MRWEAFVQRVFWLERKAVCSTCRTYSVCAEAFLSKSFSLGGWRLRAVGRLATTAIQNRDMPVLQGTVLFTTVLVIAGNLIADLLYSVLDPRIRKEA